MAYILQIHFPYDGPWGSEMVEIFSALAESIALEQGMIWKIWTENRKIREAGGIYLFHGELDAERYLKMHKKRLEEKGVHHLKYRIFEVNNALSKLTAAPI